MDQLVLIQMSDLHFGAPLGSGLSDRMIRRKYLKATGRMPHDPALAEALPIAFEEVKRATGLRNGDHCRFLLTGDLTSGGAPREFGWVSDYIRGRAIRSPRDPSHHGLAIDEAGLASIPGNHDHWNDGTWLGYPSFQEWLYSLNIFDRNPRVWRSSGAGFEIQIYSVDSSSGIPSLVENSRANGHISPEEFERLENQLNHAAKSAERVIRIIACHHSLSCRQERLDRTFAANRLDPGSCKKLAQVARRHRVTAILTGHVHCFWGPARLDSWTDLYNTHEVREITCSTTLKWRLGHNGFWAHQFVSDSHGLKWTAHRWMYDRDRRRFFRDREEEPIHALMAAAGRRPF